MKRTAIKRGTRRLARTVGLTASKGLSRGEGALKRSRMTVRPKRRSSTEELLRERWNDAVPRGMDGHHAIRRQVIERLARSAGLDEDGVLHIAWDLDWMIPLSRAIHAAHTNRSKRLPVEVVPQRAWRAVKRLDNLLGEAGRPRMAAIELEREYRS